MSAGLINGSEKTDHVVTLAGQVDNAVQVLNKAKTLRVDLPRGNINKFLWWTK